MFLTIMGAFLDVKVADMIPITEGRLRTHFERPLDEYYYAVRRLLSGKSVCTTTQIRRAKASKNMVFRNFYVSRLECPQNTSYSCWLWRHGLCAQLMALASANKLSDDATTYYINVRLFLATTVERIIYVILHILPDRNESL